MLEDLVGQNVAVYSRSGTEVRDEGILESCDGPFLVLRKGEDRLVFVLYNVRLIKPDAYLGRAAPDAIR